MSDSTFNAASTAVLIVDLQNDFLHPEGAYGRSGTSSPEIAALPSLLIGQLRRLLGIQRDTNRRSVDRSDAGSSDLSSQGPPGET